VSRQIEKASDLFNNQRYHCSQAVLGAFAEDLGITEEQALKIGGCFGAGMCYGEVCGCVTGALMAFGLKYGQCRVDDLVSRQKTNDMTIQFMEKFKTENGSYMCKELLGYDFSKPEEAKIIAENKLFLDICPPLVESAIRIAEKLMV